MEYKKISEEINAIKQLKLTATISTIRLAMRVILLITSG
jgi:hypothetical protein